MKFFFILTIVLFTDQVKATTQISDVLYLGKDTLFLYDSPLEEIKNIGGKILDLRTDGHVVSSDCWRGFRAEWKIIDEVLYLANVIDCYSEKKLNSLIEEILGTKFTDGLIKAEFVSGDYWVGKDEAQILSVYVPIYKYEIKFVIEDGRIVDSVKFESIQCEYTADEHLKNFIIKNINHEEFSDFKEEIIKISAGIKSDRTGRIRNVRIEHSTHPETNSLFQDAIMKLPCRPVYFNKGEYWSNEESIYLSFKTKELKEYVR